MTLDLFNEDSFTENDARMGEQACVLRGFASADTPQLLVALQEVLQQAPLRHMSTPGGHSMSVATTNCGPLGWITDQRGYRYSGVDPQSQAPWPDMPEVFDRLAQTAAATAGFADFYPDACLINCYAPGAKMSLHQDRNERDRLAPIVSVSLGMPAVFLFGGHTRSDPTQRHALFHGDVAVWGGVDRLRFHGVVPVKSSPHAILGAYRFNLTFRRAG